ncbi:MAG TPA: ribosome maturation factor RimP [Bryobacteraceae bacterium]|jgi:ribosome maturation factor RimP|nr:ribosome maturation factor RimP [Bryobacteraceae bacterium]
MKRDEAIATIQTIAEGVAASGGLEIVEVELKGSGKNQLLRVTIDKPAGVTHADCEFVSRELGDRLDTGDVIDTSYQLEVSSPGVERKLKKWRDWERFQGQKAKVTLKPDAGSEKKHFDGTIARAAVDSDGTHAVTVTLADGAEVTFPFEQVDHANLKFEW